MNANMLPQTAAIELFIRESGADYYAAVAYLPTAYDWCGKCDTRETHEHPMAKMISDADVIVAVGNWAEDEAEAEQDRFISRYC